MPPKKKTETPGTISNVNTNTNTNNNVNNNTNHVHVNIEQPKHFASKKPNWILKAIVVAVIGSALSLICYYIKKNYDGENHRLPGVENATPISGTKTN